MRAVVFEPLFAAKLTNNNQPGRSYHTLRATSTSLSSARLQVVSLPSLLLLIRLRSIIHRGITFLDLPNGSKWVVLLRIYCHIAKAFREKARRESHTSPIQPRPPHHILAPLLPRCCQPLVLPNIAPTTILARWHRHCYAAPRHDDDTKVVVAGTIEVVVVRFVLGRLVLFGVLHIYRLDFPLFKRYWE